MLVCVVVAWLVAALVTVTLGLEVVVIMVPASLTAVLFPWTLGRPVVLLMVVSCVLGSLVVVCTVVT